MYQINYKHPIHVYFMGIGGVSMSGLAEILLKEGFTISGSDRAPSLLTKQLENKGVQVFYGQKASNLSDSIDLVVYTAAISPDNEEYQEALALGLPMLTRAQLLGQLMKNYQVPIAISGTHGKTSTTSMLTEILLAAKLNPTVSIGGMLKSIGGNIRVGDNQVFLTEACEYTNSFLDFFPKISVILNIDEDHLDFFENLAHIRSSFSQFAALLPEDGTLIINGEIPKIEEIIQPLSCKVLRYGRDTTFPYCATNVLYNEYGMPSFDFIRNGTFVQRIQLAVPGEHNIQNALASIAVGDTLALSMEHILSGIESFQGTGRRFEKKGTYQQVTIVDDYAHHPTEIRATLSAARKYPHQDIWCIFQPHTYTRTKSLFSEFVDALSSSDHVILTDIYAARETDTLGVSSEALVDALKQKGVDAYHISSFSEIADFCCQNCKQGDLLITMGAGDVVNIGESILRK